MDQIFLLMTKEAVSKTCGKILQPVKKSGSEPNVVRRKSFQDARAYHQPPT